VIVCKIVLLAAVCSIIPSPIKTISTSEREKILENDKMISPAVKRIAAAGTILPNFRTVLREARKSTR